MMNEPKKYFKIITDTRTRVILPNTLALIGVSIGGAMGYFGGKFELITQRIIEVWASLPLLFVIIILSSILRPSFILLIGIYTLVNWIFLTYYMRAEFYREKTKDYVSASISMGQSNVKIIFKVCLV